MGNILHNVFRVVIAVAVFLIAVKRSWIFCGGIVLDSQFFLLVLGMAYLVWSVVPGTATNAAFGMICIVAGGFFLTDIYPINLVGGLLLLLGIVLIEEPARKILKKK